MTLWTYDRFSDVYTDDPMRQMTVRNFTNNPIGAYQNLLRGIQEAIVENYTKYFAEAGLGILQLPEKLAERVALNAPELAMETIRHLIPDFEKPKLILRCADCGEEVDVIDLVHYSLMYPARRHLFHISPAFFKYDTSGLLIKYASPDDDDDDVPRLRDRRAVLCHKCAANHEISRCIDCGEFYITDQGEFYRGYCYCPDCVEDNWTTCDDCNSRVPYGQSYRTASGNRICSECFNEAYFTCDDCGEIFLTEDRYTLGDDWLCPSCYEDRNDDDSERYDEDGAYVHVYNWKPRGIFYDVDGPTDDRDKLFYGFELEVSGSHRHAPDFLSFFDDTDFGHENSVYLKSDCSIREGGFEIVTHPMTMEYIKGTFINTLKSALDDLRKKKFKGHNYGGMHVHISRNMVSYNQWDKMTQMLSDGDNEQAWLFLTQRKKNQLDQWAKLKCRMSSSENDLKYRYENKCTMANDRYTAINATPNTIEFRIFNSNLRTERVLKNLEICQAMYDFTKPVQRKNISMDNFIKFVRNHEDKYPNLVAFLDEKDWDNLVASNFDTPATPDAVAAEA